MGLSRRDFLKLTGLISASAALASCAPGRLFDGAVQPISPVNQAHFQALNRLTFGPRPADLVRVAEIGLAGWVEEQLAPDLLDDFACHFRLRNLDTLNMTAQQLVDYSDKLFDDVDRLTIPAQLRRAALLRQVYSRRQLYEVIVEFWNDHFHIAVEKGSCFYLKTVDDRSVARAHAFRNFRDLLWASAHSPAMLTYLDNQVNHKGAPNENYARELMELHSLGVQGGYSQSDVMEMARCLTGWGVKDHFWAGEFHFDPDLHDPGEKVVLGMRIPPGGILEAESVIERLAAHPAAARFIVTKLARRFLADQPPTEIVEKGSAAFRNSGGDIKAALRTILLDGLPFIQPRYRRPVNFVAASLRMLNADSDCGPALQDYLLRMGQLAFNWPTPDGYPDRSEAWQGNLMPRWQFAFALTRDTIAKTQVDLLSLTAADGAQTLPEQFDALSIRLLGAPLPTAERDRLLGVLETTGAEQSELLSVLAGGLLASPAFQWR